MSQPPGPHQNPHTQQQNYSAHHNSNVFANNGAGNQRIRIHTAAARPKRTWAWIALVGLLIADFASYQYGQAAYTGGVDESGDFTRATVFIALMVITVLMLRICGRDIKNRFF
ncbi:hypothetical protein [Nocardia jiangsuensis]|uniref:Uncharacterized protein n=1 Tax=Nocardia jiangsuensis TaxID=1691563 RepID=A0ABV8E152_9NOCA